MNETEVAQGCKQAVKVSYYPSEPIRMYYGITMLDCLNIQLTERVMVSFSDEQSANHINSLHRFGWGVVSFLNWMNQWERNRDSKLI